jgi:hypothetical protein
MERIDAAEMLQSLLPTHQRHREIEKDEDNPVMHLLEKLQASPAIIGGVSFSTKAA